MWVKWPQCNSGYCHLIPKYKCIDLHLHVPLTHPMPCLRTASILPLLYWVGHDTTMYANN
jgi:hypothetical protein